MTFGRKQANSVDSDGDHVNVGDSSNGGVNVNNNWDDNRNDNLGLWSARKLSQVKANALLFWRAFVLKAFCGFYPSPEHSSDFIGMFLKQNILFVIKGFHFFGETDKNPEQV